jgi:hypothetical protein
MNRNSLPVLNTAAIFEERIVSCIVGFQESNVKSGEMFFGQRHTIC